MQKNHVNLDILTEEIPSSKAESKIEVKGSSIMQQHNEKILERKNELPIIIGPGDNIHIELTK